MGSITLVKFIPVDTFCEFAESITRWKCAKRKYKTFQLLHHRVIELTELTIPGDTSPEAQAFARGYFLNKTGQVPITQNTDRRQHCQRHTRFLYQNWSWRITNNGGNSIVAVHFDRMSVNFTFDLISGSGIADQLGAQFAHLYTLGVKCGWNYKHLKATTFNRSLLFVPTKHRARSKLSEILGFHVPVRRNGCLSPDALTEYLGLGVLNSDEDSPHTKLPLAFLLADCKSIDEIKIKVINELRKCCGAHNASSDPLLRVTIDHAFHSKLDHIHRLLGMSYEQVLDFAGETFLKPRLSNKHARRTITRCLHKGHEKIAVIHLRLGDSLYLPTAKGCIILHGLKSYRTVSEYYENVKAVDPNRTPWFDPYLVSYQVQRELTIQGISVDHCYLISDGFELSRKALNFAVSTGTTPRRLFLAAKRKIDELEQQFSEAFHWIRRENRVIGEGDYETIQSIELIRAADLILSNNGGFSYVIHRLYQKRKSGASFVFVNRERLL